MAEEAAAEGQDESGSCPPPEKCPECPPGLPAWMATFSDLVTLLLTFFVLLLSFAKTETAKYESVMGSIRNAFAGNVLKKGEVLQLGKSADDSPEMVDSPQPIRPFPIEFLTTEGFLDKLEINRESDEILDEMRDQIRGHDLQNDVTFYEMPEGIKIKIKDRIYFETGSVKVSDEGDAISRRVLDRMVKLMTSEKYTLFIEGHASKGEVSGDGKMDAFALSAKRAEVVTRNFIQNGVAPERVSTVFYGDTRPDKVGQQVQTKEDKKDRRVEFVLRKVDLRTEGKKVPSR